MMKLTFSVGNWSFVRVCHRRWRTRGSQDGNYHLSVLYDFLRDYYPITVLITEYFRRILYHENNQF